MMKMLELVNVSSRYEKTLSVLRNINLTAEKGRTTCVLGPNGAGKSTLLRTIVNILRPFEGTVTYKGQSLKAVKTHDIIKMGMSVVPESRRLFPKLTVKETLVLGGMANEKEGVSQARMEEVFELFPILKQRQGQLSGTLSGGELGFLSIARAMMSGPDMILLDEPSLGLAPKMVSRVFKTINKINQRGITILLIEQNAKKSLEIASYGYVLQKGAVVAQGDVDELKQTDIIKKAYLK
jgi:branched-chain amino acid transport system ATP-binding protein